MLADTLKRINTAEEQADNLLARANQQVQEIERQTYQKIEQINAEAERAVATAIAQLPPLPVAPLPDTTITVPQNKMDEAVAYITQAFPGV